MKKYFSVFMLFLLILPVNAQQRKKVGLVLSGGGAKGVAHIGALKVIEEAGIPIDLVVGTSMGSIVGGLYSIGYTPHQLDSMVKTQNWSFLLSDRMRHRQKTFLEREESEKYVISLPFRKKPQEILTDGIIKGQNLKELFTDLTIGYHDSIDFDTLPLPFACVAVDIMEGKEVVFHSGKLAEAMRASMAIPAVFTPVRMDNMVLIDGGLLNNFPVDVARAMGADVVIGVDVRSEWNDKDKVTSLIDVIYKLNDIAEREKYIKNRNDVDAYIKVNVDGYNSASFSTAALDTLTLRGEAAARVKWDELKELKAKIGIADDFVPEHHDAYVYLSKGERILIRDIYFYGASKKDMHVLQRSTMLHEHEYATVDQLRKAVDNLYALQAYTNIYYTLVHRENGYDLEFTMEENKLNLINLGIRFDTEEVASVQVNGSYQLKGKIPSKVALTGRLGLRSGFRLDYQMFFGRLQFLNASYMFQRNDIDLYRRGNREYNTTYNRHFFELSYTGVLNQNMKIGLGLRYEHFNYDTFLFNNAENTVVVKPEGFYSYFALFRYNTLDQKNYPTRGVSLHTDFYVYTDNLSTYKDNPPFGAANLWCETAFSPTRRFSILPSFYGRVLFGQDSPYPFMNVVGGDVPGRYLPHQIPFIGISHIEVVDNSILAGMIKLRQRMGNKNYLSLIANYALTDNDLGNILKGRQLFGVGISYGYYSLIGPIEATFSVSNRTNELGFYGNIGFKF